MAKQQIVIPRGGITSGEQKVRAIYSPLVAGMLEQLGESELRRASHVEPGSEIKEPALHWLFSNCNGAFTTDPFYPDGIQMLPQYKTKWWADLLPVGGPVLGPYNTNTEALQAEVDWLKLNNIPICVPCREAAIQDM